MKLDQFCKTCRKHPKLLLTIAIAVSAAVVYYQYVFGDYIFLFNDIGSDTQQQYIMQYNTIINHLRDGNFSFWDFNNGFGTSMFQLTLADPSLWVLYILGWIFGPASCAYLLIYLHIGKMILAGLAAYYFLSCFSLSKRSRLLAAYIYAFNGFLIVWGQHYQFSMVMILLPCLLAVVEKAVQGRKFSLKLPLMTGVVVFYSYYTGYMSLILCGTYVVFRLLAENMSWKERFLQTGKHALAMLLGVGMALVTLLPNFYLVSSVTSRLSSGMTLFQRVYSAFTRFPEGYYKTLVSRFFSSNLEGIGNEIMPYTGYNNYYEAPNVFFSVLFVICLIQFLFLIPKISKSKKEIVLWYAATALVTATLCIMSFSVVLNGFAYPISRHTFLMIPLFAFVTAKSLDEILKRHNLSRIGIALSLFLILALYIPGFFHANTASEKLNAVAMCGTGIGMILVLFCMIYAKGKAMLRFAPFFFCSLCLVTGINVISDSHITARHRSEVKKGSEEYFDYLYNEDMQNILSYVEENDPEFHRMEKNFSQVSICMESCAQNYRGIGTYNSTMNKNVQEFVQKMLPELEYKNAAHLTYTQITRNYAFANLFGIRYLISDYLDESNTGYHFVKQFGSLYLYEMNQETSIGHLFTKTVDSANYENAAMTIGLDRDVLISQAAVTDSVDELNVQAENLDGCIRKSVPSIINFDALSTEEASSSQQEGVINFNTSLYELPLNFNNEIKSDAVTMEFDMQINQTTNVFFTINNNANEFQMEANVPTRISLTIPVNAESILIEVRVPAPQAVISGINCWEQNINAVFEALPISVNETNNDSRISGNILASQKSLAVLSIPYEEGWTAEVDGEPVEIVRANYGFSAFYVEKGEHDFSLTYRQPMLREGACISFLFLLMYFASAILIKRREKR